MYYGISQGAEPHCFLYNCNLMKLSNLLKQQSVARNSIYSISSQVIINIVGVFVSGYVATALGDIDYGKFAFAFAFVQTFSSLSNMGIHVVQIREIAKDKNAAPDFFGSTLVFRVLFALLAYCLIATAISLLDYPTITKTIVFIAGLTLIFTYITDSCLATFRGYEKMQFSAMINIVTAFFSVCLRVVVIYLGYRLLVLSWTVAFISFGTAIVSYIIICKYFFKPVYVLNFQKFKNIFFLTLPFYSMHIFMEAYKRLDVVLLSILKGDAEVGWYNASAILFLRLLFIPSAISGAILPVMSRLITVNKNKEWLKVYRDGLFILFLLGLPLAIGTVLSAEKIILLIYDIHYSESIIVLQILSFSLPLMFLSFHMQNALFSLNNEKAVTWIIGIYTILSILLNVILIPQFGHVGAAISGLLTQISNFLLNYLYLRFYLKIVSFDFRLVKICFSGLIMGAALYLLYDVSLIMMIIVGAAVYPVSLIAFRVVTQESLTEFRSMILQNK